MPALLIAMEDALVVARPAGGAGGWEVASHLREAAPVCLAADPGHPARLYCGTRTSGLWRSENGGATWEWVGEGIRQARVTAVAVSPVEQGPSAGFVYAGTEPSAVYLSEDGGGTWRERTGLAELPSASSWSFPPRPDTHHVRWIGCDPGAAGRIHVAIEAGALLRSPDGGDTWEDRRPGGPIDTHTLALHPDAPGRIWSAAGDGYFESRDGGTTWDRPDDGLGDPYGWSVAVDPGDPETVVVSAAPGPAAAHQASRAESRIWRRAGGGRWRNVTRGLPSAKGMTAAVLAVHASEPGVFYAACNLGVFRSEDGGASWRALDLPWPDRHRRQRVQGFAVLPS